MKKQFLFLILCIGLLLSGCQKTPEASPAAQPVEPPWETESPDVLPSYTAYFTEIRMYDTADYAYTPAWLQTGDYEIDCIDGKLAEKHLEFEDNAAGCLCGTAVSELAHGI